ncbi:pyridoxal phosphate-dependent aminotransferase [Candidatus Bathyarchaeota archaeon]|nr:pyridoxal phosphate-dependent aminotransferase [Candidatus Bathyarchaeota archaeon]MBS7629296.1 pyridoxal phosphate-dependent aminotransferase [Candidatus Bathyarchaeota archaeon]
MIMISERVRSIYPSLTLGITAKAKELKRRGVDVTNLGAGEPDFPTSNNIKEAAKRAIDNNFTYYTPTSGIEELREAIAEKLRRFNNVKYEPQEIVLSCGGKHSLYNIMQVLLNPGDETLLPIPYWVSYLEQVKLAGGRPVLIPAGEDGRINIDAMRGSVTEKTRMVILNTPSNPDGKVLSRRELEAVADLALEHGLWIVSDEVYEAFVYDGLEHVSIASLSEEVKGRTVISNSFSKTYSMTGWRIGYTAGPVEVTSAIGRLQDHMTSNPTSISQIAALEALRGPQDFVERMVQEFSNRRRLMVSRLSDMENIECEIPQGAFYTFPKIKVPGLSSTDFAERLLNEAKVAVIPGLAFGKDGYLRLSYATSIQEIDKGMDRMENFCRRLH